MYFEYDEYYRELYKYPLIIIIVGILAVLWILYNIVKKINEDFRFEIKNIFFIIPLIFISIFLYLQIIILNLGIREDSNVNTEFMSGEIEYVKSVYYTTKLQYEGEVVDPSVVTINNQEYYIMTIGDFEVGDNVVIEFLPNSLVVMSINYDND